MLGHSQIELAPREHGEPLAHPLRQPPARLLARVWRGRVGIVPALFTPLLLAACNNASGPTDPTVDEIIPTQGRPGDRVVISGDEFGVDSTEVTVTFGDSAATVVQVGNKHVVTRVPPAAPGQVQVVVTVSGRRSEPVSFTILRPLPEVLSFHPPTVRAGDVLTLTGRELQGASVAVTLNADTLAPGFVTDTLLTVSLPLALQPGDYDVGVVRDGDASDAVLVPVEVFTVTGTYAVQGMVVFNNCAGGPAVGTAVATQASVTDSRPSVQLLFGNTGPIPLLGILDPDGSFRASQAELSDITGQFGAAPAGDAGFEGRLDVRTAGLSCRTTEDLTATRTSPLP
jgi:hypothetical protein